MRKILRYADLELRRLAIRADVHEACGIVVADGQPQLQAAAEHPVLPIARKLLPRERRRADEVHGHASARVGPAANIACNALALVIGGAVETDARDRGIELARERAEPD